MNKTLMLFNLRFANLHSHGFFENIKKRTGSRLVVVIDDQFESCLDNYPDHVFDCIYKLNSRSEFGFLPSFDINDMEKVVSQEFEITDELRLICMDEHNLLNVARLCEAYGLPGYGVASMARYRDKSIMNEFLRQAGVRVPKSVNNPESLSYEELSLSLGRSFILKPADACGSNGFAIINNCLELEKYRVSYHRYMAEEYIEGTLFHIDTCVRNNHIEFIQICEYSCPNAELAKGKVLGSIPLQEGHPFYSRLVTYATEILSLLSADNMVNHMEVFISDDEVCFLEMAARPPGGLICRMHELNTGINLVDEAFMLQSGIDAHCMQRSGQPICFWAYLPMIPGKVKELHHPVLDSQVVVNWEVRPGDVIKPDEIHSVMSKSGSLMATHSDYRSLYQDFNKLRFYSPLMCDPC